MSALFRKHTWHPGRAAIVVAALTASASASASATARATLRVELHPVADVASMHVTLGEIATITGDDAAVAARVAAIEVGDVAADGSASVVDRAALVRWVHARASTESRDFEWSGAPACRVRRVVPATVGTAVAGDATPPLHPAMVGGARPLVMRGGNATLRSVDGPISLESRVEVHDDGSMGQDVHVRLPGATADVLARVTGAGRVEVQR